MRTATGDISALLREIAGCTRIGDPGRYGRARKILKVQLQSALFDVLAALPEDDKEVLRQMVQKGQIELSWTTQQEVLGIEPSADQLAEAWMITQL